ncbi:MAG: GHKL domain-containing protein [Clostridia bacterium]
MLLKILFTDEHCTKKQIISIIGSSIIMVTLGMVLKGKLQIIGYLTVSIFMFLTGKYMLKLTKLQSLSIPFLTFAFLSITELLACTGIMVIFRKPSHVLLESTVLYFLVIVLQILLAFGIIQLILHYKEKLIGLKNNLNKMSPKQVKMFLFIVAICLVPQVAIFVLTKYSYPPVFLFVNSIQLICVCVITISYFNITVGKELVVSELTLTKLHNKTMSGMIDGVRTIKHDYNNIIQALNGYMSTKQYDKLQDHINSVLGECSVINNISTIDPKVFNDPAIYGIVGSKFFIANEKDIPVELDITTNIAEIQFSKPDLSRILGILIDNAIEATDKINDKYIKIEMSYDKKKCSDVIKIFNTFSLDKNIDLNKIYEKGFSSKKIKSGIGLWEVKKIVSKNSNSQIFATIEKNKFVQNLIIEKSI